MSPPTSVWTIGHSNRSAEDLLATLEAYRIEVLADVRRFPGSRRHPQFSAEALAAALAGRGLDYLWIPGLGGRRRAPPAPRHAGWRNDSFRAYAAYMETEDFAAGLDELLHVASARRTAIMCSEVLWWRCHRALISDVLRFLGIEVVHIMDARTNSAHPYTSPARIRDGELMYPAEASARPVSTAATAEGER